MLALPPPHPRPLERYREVAGALIAAQPHGEHSPWLRAAALAALRAPGTGDDVAASIAEEAAALSLASGWLDPLGSSLRYLAAALLVATDHEAVEFLRDLERTRALFTQAGLHGRSPEAIIGALLLHLEFPTGVPEARVAVIRALLKQMTQRHWWFTSAEDLPLCVLLSSGHGTPEDISERMDRLFHALHDLGCMPSRHLQSAAALLCLDGREPHALAAAMGHLLTEAARRFLAVERDSYESMALLSLIRTSPGEVLDQFERLRDGLGQDRGLGEPLRTALAADLAVLTLAQAGSPTPELAQAGGGLLAVVALEAIRAIEHHAVPVVP